MKKVLVLVLALVLISTSALAAEIGFLPPAMTSPFYAACIEGAEPVATASGYELLIMAPPSEDDYATQMSMMEDMITRGVAGIAVCGINLDALIPGIKKANEAGIPVVMFNTITVLEGVDVYAYSGYNQYNGGGKIADWVNQQTGGQAKVAIIEGLPSDYTTQRMGGFIDRCKEAYPGIEVVATQPGDWVRELGMNAAMDMLQAHPEISVIYGLSDEMALGAVQAIKQLGRDDIIVVGLDGNPNAFESVKAGELTATLDCGPVAIGANAILAIVEALEGVERTEKIIEAETTVVDITLVDNYIK
ncbi:MAG: sugar ABC transporter substrate-binding protein [Clostridiales bacterium]|jgi:ribose transport system substrate-binding protein|nr:sugar ABC transporter substrate-binding protein [Clostridiales bacterium]OPZ70105.1 MAG: D-ribose-binding periplasmic protein precursor [Firmicutes bacterium ADurb.Bin467]